MNVQEKSGAAGRRHIRYVDHAIQKWMLIALVAIEVALVALAVWGLDLRLREHLDAQLYRVHFTAQAPGAAELLAEAGRLVAAFSVINLLVLIAAEALWARYVDAVVGHFAAAMARMRRLDLTAAPPRSVDHEVLGLAEAWRHREHLLLEQVRADIARLEQGPPKDTAAAAALRTRLEALCKRLA